MAQSPDRQDVVLTTRSGETITDWRDWTPPKDPKQWKAGRSAMELARAWFTSPAPQCPREIEALLSTCLATAGIAFERGIAEAITGLPFRGGGRNHDLLLWGSRQGASGQESVIVSVEGKADEKFGNQTIGYYYAKAQLKAKVAIQDKTKVPTRANQRIEVLVEMIFGSGAAPDQMPWSALRYQLLTGIAAIAVVAANQQAANQKASTGIFLVHEFHTASTTAPNIAANAVDYANFVAAFYGIAAGSVQSGEMYGPRVLDSDRFLKQPVAIYIGKAIKRI